MRSSASLGFLSAAAAAAAVLLAPPGSAHAAPPAARVVLPAPTGAAPVGVTSLAVDVPGRADPWRPDQQRRLMISVFYPASRTAAPAPPFAPAEAQAFAQFAARANYGVPPGRIAWSATRLPAGADAPVAPHSQPLRVILYSPGVGDNRNWDASLVTELASRGYAVVTIDHTYEPSAVQFPDGTLASTVLPQQLAAAQRHHTIERLLRKVLAVRVADVRDVLDALPGLSARFGGLDSSRVGMFGHSAGGFAAAQAMHDDPRLVAGVDMDGVLAYNPDDGDSGNLSTAARDGVRHPFLLYGDAADTPATNPSWRALIDHSGGKAQAVALPDSEHGSFTDAEVALAQAARAGALDRADVRRQIGTIRPTLAIALERGTLDGFFARFLPAARPACAAVAGQ